MLHRKSSRDLPSYNFSPVVSFMYRTLNGQEWDIITPREPALFFFSMNDVIFKNAIGLNGNLQSVFIARICIIIPLVCMSLLNILLLP